MRLPHCWRPKRPASSSGSVSRSGSRTRCSPRRSTDRHRSHVGGSYTSGSPRSPPTRRSGLVISLMASPTADEGTAAEIEHGAALAERRGAPEAAAELYEAACRLTPAGRPEDLARRTLGVADALTMAGDLGGARSLAITALEMAVWGRSVRVHSCDWLRSRRTRRRSKRGSATTSVHSLRRATIKR